MRGKTESGGALKRKMFYGMLLLIIPVMILVTVIFWRTRTALKEEYIRSMHYDLEEITSAVDEKLDEISYLSDVYAGNTELIEYAQQNYRIKGSTAKQSAIVRIYRDILEAVDWLSQREQLGAIYTRRGELLNFLDPNNDNGEVRGKLEEMGINDGDKLMQLVWYPVRENFLVSRRNDNVHERMAVFGSRRVYSWTSNRYEYVQIFALKEEVFYNLYKEKADSMQGEIYIMDGQGHLISASNEKSLESGSVPAWLRSMLEREDSQSFEYTFDGKRRMVCMEKSEVNDWQTVMIVPASAVTSEVDGLYFRFAVLLLLCMGFSGMLLLWLYKSFMEPIGRLNSSMREVYGGNLNAYVEVSKKKSEINDMMVYYNSMLHRINTHIIEGLKADRKKKELELEVLMSQINPHFLYNTLENIVWKSNEAGHPDIGRIAASLGRMYRLSISGGQIIVPMEHEIEHLMAYVKIQQNRYGGSVSFDLRTDMEQIRGLYSLKILLQPLVENSFLYAMEGIERRLNIRLSIRVQDGWVTIRVADNGCGMGKERLEQVRNQIVNGRKQDSASEKNRRSTGIGLHSVQMRIKLYFGLENAVAINSRQGCGTVVVVKIPKITASDVDEYGNLRQNP